MVECRCVVMLLCFYGVMVFEKLVMLQVANLLCVAAAVPPPAE